MKNELAVLAASALSRGTISITRVETGAKALGGMIGRDWADAARMTERERADFVAKRAGRAVFDDTGPSATFRGTRK